MHCGYGRVGRKSSKTLKRRADALTMLLGEKSLKIIDHLKIEFKPFCRLKLILMISECTFIIQPYFASRDTAPLRWILILIRELKLVP